MYCVKCGVELDRSAEKCPLCDTKILLDEEDLDIENKQEIKPPYSQAIMIPPRRQKQFVAFVISMILLIPSVVCVVANLLFRDEGLWSVYMIGSALVVWVAFVLPFLKKLHVQLLIFLDAIALCGYMLIFNIMKVGDSDWFLNAALPCVLLLWLGVALFTMWLSKEKRDWPDVGMVVLTEIGIYSLCVDAILERYFATGWTVRYSVIIAVSCLLLILFFLGAGKNKFFRAWLTRNFYY